MSLRYRVEQQIIVVKNAVKPTAMKFKAAVTNFMIHVIVFNANAFEADFSDAYPGINAVALFSSFLPSGIQK